MKKAMGKVMGNMTQIMACLAMVVAAMNMNSTCYFLTYQPDAPEK